MFLHTIAETSSSGITGTEFAIIALLIAVCGAVAVYVTYKGRSGTSLTDIQDKTITTQREELTLAKEKIQNLERQAASQQAQIDLLSKLVTQAAKVDDLSNKVDGAFLELGNQVKTGFRSVLDKFNAQ